MSKVRIYGDTSGYVDIAVPAVAGTTTLNLDKIPQADINGDIAMDTNTLYVDAANNRVGIGTATPGKKLHIKDSIPDIRLEDTDTNAVVELRGNTGTGSFVIATDVNNAVANSKIVFEVDNDEKVRIDDSGNVGIGGTPNVYSNYTTLTLNHNTSGGILDIERNGNLIGELYTTSATDFGIQTGQSTGAMRLRTNAGEVLTLLHTGNVGIGQTAPTYKFEVSGSGDTVQYIANANPSGTQGRTLLIRDNYASASQDSKISFASTSSPGQDVYLGKRTTNNAGFFHLTNSSGTEHMTVEMANGNVGIGTISPSVRLHVVGGGDANLYLQSDSSRSGAFLMKPGTSSVMGSLLMLADESYRLGTASNYHIEMNQNGNTLLNTTGNNVGIGTNAPTDILEISRTSTDQTVGLTLTNQQAGGYGSGIVWRSKRTDNSAIVEAAEIRVTGENSWNGASNVSSQMQFATQKDGTLTQHMLISKNGFVGIGTNTPSADLHVERGSNNNTGHFKMGHTGQRRGYVGINSSETRWYKIMNYASGEIFTGVAQLFHQRGGGYNQTGAYRTYNMSVAGYSNGIYGPTTATGDSGEGGSGTLEFGSDEALYLRVNASVYAGTIYFTFTGTGNGVSGGWQFNVNNYSTSLP